ncbi:hypothetical protein OIU78_000416 [Salix suchowensis]|nr:hypothetical protein OIU78_000416 [Salix suchowensis]
MREQDRIIRKYHDPIIDDRIQQWKDGKKKDIEDLLDVLITLNDDSGNPLLSRDEIRAQVEEIILAAVDNPSNACEWAFAEMLNNPEILERAVEELDRVVGKQRLVQESDFAELNYVKACAREAFRLHPIAPFNVPHVSMADTVVANYFIPKGKVVLAENGLRFISFSTGKRGCMAVTLGSAMTNMLFARLLQGFSWSLPSNEPSIDLSTAKDSMALSKPLLAAAKPRLPAHLYPE